jgi:Tfp pilus assembly protein PilO
VSRRVVIIGALLIVALLGVWWFALWQPRLEAIDKANFDAETAEQEKADVQNQLLIYSRLNEELETSSGQLVQMREAIPATTDLPSLFATIDAVANGTGVEVGTIAPAAPSAKRKLLSTDAVPTGTGNEAIEIPVTFDLRGSYEAVVMFLTELESRPTQAIVGSSRLFVVDDLSIDIEGANTLQVAVSARAFTTEPPVGGS